MDPVHNTSGQSRFDRIEAALQQHDGRLAVTEAEVRQMAASHDQVLTALAASHDQSMSAMAAEIQRLMNTLANMVTSLTPPVVPPLPAPVPPFLGPAPKPQVGTLERYAGNPEGYNPFITNCSILFALQSHTFASEEANVAFTINHLTGRAPRWGTAEGERWTHACGSFQLFTTELCTVFGGGKHSSDAACTLLSMGQGNQTVADYVTGFHTKARQSDWHPSGLWDMFLQGLAPYMKDELASRDVPPTLDGVIELATRMDLRIQDYPWGFSTTTAEPQPEGAEPMQLGHTSLSPL